MRSVSQSQIGPGTQSTRFETARRMCIFQLPGKGNCSVFTVCLLTPLLQDWARNKPSSIMTSST